MRPNSARPAVTGTTSATVIQSMPSMKFDDIDEPDAANEHDRAIQPPREGRDDAHFVRKCCDNCGDC